MGWRAAMTPNEQASVRHPCSAELPGAAHPGQAFVGPILSRPDACSGLGRVPVEGVRGH